MTKRIVALGWAGALMVFFMTAQAQSVKMNPKTDNALLTRFQDAKLGLFVHWMACHTPTTGDSWSIGRGTPKTVADSITMSWNPEKFDARRIVDVAVQSGCRYMVVISKHHDGFFPLRRLVGKHGILTVSRGLTPRLPECDGTYNKCRLYV